MLLIVVIMALPRLCGAVSMTTYHFTVVLAGLREISDELADALFEAGCDDGLAGSSNGVASVIFDRQAESLE
jgi:hypothetical protein